MAAAGFAIAAGATPAAGQIAAQGATSVVRAGAVRGVDASFDPYTNTYMVVSSYDGVFAVCTDAAGTPTSAVMTLKAPTGKFGQFPRVQYSRDLNNGAGAFLVVWSQEAPYEVRSRVVSCTAGPLGTEQAISGTAAPYIEYGSSALAYSATSQKFLVAWRTLLPPHSLVTRLVDLNGAGVGSVVTLSNELGGSAGVAWNPTLNEFGISFAGQHEDPLHPQNEYTYPVFVRMPADNIAAFTRTTMDTIALSVVFATDLAFNPETGRYVMVWWQFGVRAAEIDATGNVLTTGLVTSSLGTYDGVSLAYNPVSKTFAVATINPSNDNLVAAELNGRGYRADGFITVAAAIPYAPTGHERVASHATGKAWLTTFRANTFVNTAAQVLVTGSSDGGPAGAYAPPGTTTCSYSLSPTSATEPATGGTGAFAVTTTSGCTWTATPGAAWVHITSGASGTGPGTVVYRSDANAGAVRSATITVGGQTFTVNQGGTACGYTLNPASSGTIAAAGGTGSFTVSTGTGCTWTASTTDSWVHITAGASGTGPGTVSYSIDAVTGPPRSGAITAGGQTFAISQSGNCSYTINPSSSGAVPAAGATGSFSVTTTAGCTWTAATTATWIHVTAGASGSASGTLSYSVDSNMGAARADAITVGGRSFAVAQNAFLLPPGCTLVTVLARPPGTGSVEVLWQSSGLTLPAGQPVTLTAYGTWTDAGISLTGAGHPTAGVSGPNSPLPGGAPLLALIGRVGTSGTPFLIGAGTTITPSSGGVLYLAPQDNWYTLWDNAGSLSVSVCVDPNSGCTYAISPSSSGTIAAGGGSGSFGVTTGTGCTWSATTAASWIHVTSGSGTSSGTVSYTVDLNAGAARTGTITVGGRTYTVTQAASSATTCTSVTVLAQPVPPPGVGGVDVLWQSTGITLNAGQSVVVTATGTWSDAGVSLTADGHPSTTVAGPNCPLSGAPLMALIGRIGTTGTPFLIGASASWTPTTSGILYLAPQDNWYTIWDNAGSLSVTICVAASSCTYALNPTSSGTIAAAGGGGSFAVATDGSCAWTPVTASSWIHITSGQGPGSGTVAYAVDLNTGTARSGSITVDGRTYSVTQAAESSATCEAATVQAKPTPPPGVGGVDALWQSTGITLTAGQPVVVTATGTWSDAGVSLSAAGHPTTAVTGPNCPLSGAPLLALIGRIGTTGSPFLIGASKSWTPATSGVLYLAPQDNWYTTWDNAGSVGVSICAGTGGTCSYVLNPTSSGTMLASGGSGSFTVTTDTGCAWTAETAASWIHITSGSGPSSGTVAYAVDVDAGAARTGTITVAGQAFTISQTADLSQVCNTAPVLARPVPPPGVGGVDALWQSTGITLTAGEPVVVTATGTWSNAGVSLTAAGHPTTAVTGPNCPLSGAPLMALIGRIGTTGSPFLIGASKSWTPAASGVLYLAPQDNWYTTWDNAGSVSVSVCSGVPAGCSYTLDPSSSDTMLGSGGSSSFTVTSESGCAWTAQTAASWIHISSGSGPSSGTVSYTVDANVGAARTGTITVAGQTHTVSQAAGGSEVCNTVNVLAWPAAPPGVGGVDVLWQSTGITLTAGQPVVVAATGTWTDAGISLTAAGDPTTTVTGSNCPLSGAPLMALIGRVGGTGSPLVVGTSKSWTPTASGVLYLAPQDNWYTTWNNTGSLGVTVCR